MKLAYITTLFLLTTLATAQPLPQDKAKDEAAIRALLDRIEHVFAAGDIEGAMSVFTNDAIILQSDGPDIAGYEAIRATYDSMIKQFNVVADFKTTDILVSGDLAYEQGTYTLKLSDKTSGAVVVDLHPRHLHIFKRQADGSWKTWRLMTNSPTAPAP